MRHCQDVMRGIALAARAVLITRTRWVRFPPPLLLPVLLAGCGALKIEMIQPPDVVRWQTEITQSTNTHSKQICELQRKVFGVCAAEAGGPLP